MSALSAFFLSIVALVSGIFAPVKPTPLAISQTKVVEQATVYFNPDGEIHFSGKDFILSAVAVRITFKTITKPMIVPNPVLVKNNWVFPVKTYKIDQKAGTVSVDIAGAVASTTGYSLNNDLMLAKINFGTATPIPSLVAFDKTQTKLFDKNNKEIPLDFRN